MIGTIVLCAALAVSVEFVTRSRNIDYQRVLRDPYPDQMTVTRYPGWITRALGAKPSTTVYVSKDWVFNAGWYEVPDMNEISMISPIIQEFHRTVRQIKYTEGVGR